MATIASKKKFRHGSVTVMLTVLTVASVILLNAIVTPLAMRYGWFVNMNPTLLYPVTDACYEYLDHHVMSAVEKEPIRIIFCDDKEQIQASPTQNFILNTASEMAEHYPGKVQIEYLNVWEQPSIAKGYGVTASTSVVVAYGDQSRVCSLQDFFVFPAGNTETPTAYNGEKRLTVAMKAVVSEDEPTCYFLLNHGESLPDYSLMYAATDAGYTVSYLDALSFDIPEDCGLLISCNPTQDFTTEDNISGYSEVEKLDAYLRDGGKFMLFVSADTFAAGSFDNLEHFLETWGVLFDHAPGASGVEECYSIRDTGHALTPDGYTILGKVADSGRPGEMMAAVNGVVRLGNATGISVADAFTAAADGTYQNGLYTLSPLLRSYPGAEAWAGGRPVGRTEEGFPLMTLTQRKEDGASRGDVLVCSSVQYVAEEAMQSGSYDNEALLLSALSVMGKDDTPLHLVSQPFSDDTIHIMTTAEARTITICLSLIPSALVAVVGLVVLIRRKFA